MDSILFGLTSQTLEMYPPQWQEGVPSSATFSVWGPFDDNDDTAEFSGSATIDSVSTTFDQSSGFGYTNPKIAYLTSTANISPRRFYVAQNAASERELVRVNGINTNDYATLDSPLFKSYANGDSFFGIRIVASVDNTFVATESKISQPMSPYRVRWRYTVNSIVREHWTYFTLSRQSASHNIDVHDLRELWSDVQFEGDKDGLITGIINWAFDRVRYDLRRRNIEISRVRDAEMLDELVRSAAYMGLGIRGYAPGARSVDDFAQQTEKMYAADLEGAVLHFNVDQGPGGNITSEPSRTTVIRER
jgi:hypothetical protein